MTSVVNSNTTNGYQKQCINSITIPTPPQIGKSYAYSCHSSTESAVSPTNKETITNDVTAQKQQKKYDVVAAMKEFGYQPIRRIGKTLQGTIWKANSTKANTNLKKDINSNSNPVVIKITNKCLHKKGVALMNDKEIKVEENILHEASIMKWITFNNLSKNNIDGVVKYIDFKEDEINYFLIQEDGGQDFFKFVSQCHTLIRLKSLAISEWQYTVKLLFKQMVKTLYFMHNKLSICHLDISLENILINNIFVTKTMSSGDLQLSKHAKIKLCDWGLAEVFNPNDFRCDKYVGKTAYKAPKVYRKKEIFDSRAADIWSLGIVLFMMSIGSPAFDRPSYKQTTFKMVMNGKMENILQSWGRLNYVTYDLLDLLKKMLQTEDKRIKMSELIKHPFVIN